MKNLILVKHASGAPGLRFLGLGPNFLPKQGVIKLKSLLEANTSWAKHREINDLKKMLSNSSVVVSLWEKNTLLGFGRATSDEIYRAVLWDIVVDRNYQNLGLGKIIVNAILESNLISKTEKIYLMTTNCKKFYSKMGFIYEGNQSLMTLIKNR
tara:strand:+ start:196 stop:657 length:462 start_codon:yes stop_codon:yes gene_type:complete